jgi:hypothetical protein
VQTVLDIHINKNKKKYNLNRHMDEFMVAFAFTPGYEQEPQLNEMDFLEIDLLGPQRIRLTKSATTCSTIHQKTM